MVEKRTRPPPPIIQWGVIYLTLRQNRNRVPFTLGSLCEFVHFCFYFLVSVFSHDLWQHSARTETLCGHVLVVSSAGAFIVLKESVGFSQVNSKAWSIGFFMLLRNTPQEGSQKLGSWGFLTLLPNSSSVVISPVLGRFHGPQP